MTDKPTPTDAEILGAAEDFRSQYTHGGTTFDEFDEIGFARAALRLTISQCFAIRESLHTA